MPHTPPAEMPTLPAGAAGSAAVPTFLELGHYDVVGELGRGGFGLVLKAFDRRLGRDVAIKVLRPHAAADTEACERFVREARAMAKLRHENVVRLFAVEDLPVPHFVMEYVPGETLQRRLDRAGPLPPADAARLGAQVARALAAAHVTGMVHRDVKPGNILLDGDPPSAKLTDFGLAWATDTPSITADGAIVGTPLYMAPEQAFGLPADHRADLYSLGCVLFAMLTGKAPFEGGTVSSTFGRLVAESPRPVASVRKEIPPWLAAVVDRLLAREPSDRFPCAGAAAEALERQGEGWSPPRRRMPRRWWAAVAPAAAFGAAVPLLTVDRPRPAAPTGSAADVAAAPATAPAPRPRMPSPADGAPTYTNVVGMTFVRVGPGSMLLGGGGGSPGTRRAAFADDFYIGTHEVTQKLWADVLGSEHVALSSYSRGGAESEKVAAVPDDELGRYPMNGIAWADVRRFLDKLNAAPPAPGWAYRLPTPDEWEYAARGGPGRPDDEAGLDYALESGASAELPPGAASFGRPVHAGPVPVGGFPPNRLGLFDLHGSVIEYTEEDLDRAADPSKCHMRGGYWGDNPPFCVLRRAVEYPKESNLHGAGFRVALARVKPPAPPAPPPPENRVTFTNRFGMTFVRVGAGAMPGGGGGGSGGDRTITVGVDFEMGTHEVTQGQWYGVIGRDNHRSNFSRHGWAKEVVADVPDEVLDRYPLSGLAWQDAEWFVSVLNEKDPVPGKVYRLPTRDEWEYACRGGPGRPEAESTFHYYLRGGPTNRLRVADAHFGRPVMDGPKPVGSYPPNRLGLYDMHGGVIEHCGAMERTGRPDETRQACGGYWGDPAEFCVARRAIELPYHQGLMGAGFRVVLAAIEAPPAPSPRP